MEDQDKELWDRLYNQRAEALRGVYEESDFSIRGKILAGLDSLIEGNYSFRKIDQSRARGIKRETYLQEINSLQEGEQILEILKTSDQKSVRRFITDKAGTIKKAAEQTGIPATSLRTVLERFSKDGKFDNGYNAAKFAHWLLKQGYQH